MNKNFLIDYCGYILLKLLGPVMRIVRPESAVAFGSLLGSLYRLADFKHRSRVYLNLKTAFPQKSPQEIKKLVRGFYSCFGSNLIEIFLVPKINTEYIKKYIRIEGLEHINEGFARGKGILLLGVHAGSWELSNIICANLGFPFHLFAREQKLPRIGAELDKYRHEKGCRMIEREGQLRGLIKALKSNHAVGMTLDQGGKSGILVDFLGKDASMALGAVKLALKHDVSVIPVFSCRIKGPYLKIVVEPPFALKRMEDPQDEEKENVQGLARIFADRIARHPAEYLWTYKVWKYSLTRSILILDDGKTGHLRQSQALAGMVGNYLSSKGITADISTIKPAYKSRFRRDALSVCSLLSGKYACCGCLLCLKNSMETDSFAQLAHIKPDIVISCGSGLASVNLMLKRENASLAMTILKPSILPARRFDLAVIPVHDGAVKGRNVARTYGALNLIDEPYLASQKEALVKEKGLVLKNKRNIGILLGGDTRDFKLEPEKVSVLLKELKALCDEIDAQILATSSRRTGKDVEEVMLRELKDHPRTKLLIIASQANTPAAVGGILALSSLLVVSPESVSMVSEAAGSGRHTLVFDACVGKRHRKFLDSLSRAGYITVFPVEEAAKRARQLLENSSQPKKLDNSQIVLAALKKAL